MKRRKAVLGAGQRALAMQAISEFLPRYEEAA